MIASLNDLLVPICPGLYMLPGHPDGRFPRSHAFVVRGEVETLIDAGCGQERLAELLSCWRPDQVIISHAHPDHMSGLWQVQGARVWSPAQRADAFWRFAPQSVRFVGEELAPTWVRYIKGFTGVREARATHHFQHGHRFDMGGISLEAIHTPGHMEDHYVLLEPASGTVLTFDIDLTAFGPWYGHAESDIDQSLASIERVAELKPAALVSSHKGPVTNGIQERLRAYAAVVDRRDQLLLDLLSRPRTVAGLVQESPIYRGHPYAPEILKHWEGSMIRKHLDRLAARGAVYQREGRWSVPTRTPTGTP